MKSRQIIILGVIFVILVGIYFFLQRPSKQDVSGLYENITPSFNTEDVTEIAVSVKGKEEKALLIHKKDGNWIVKVKRDGKEFWAPAKSTKVEKVLNDLKGLDGELRGEGQDIFADFNLKDDQGLSITIKGKDGKFFEIRVGKKGPRWGTSFVRLSDSKKVYLASKDLLVDFDIWSKEPQKPIEIQPWIDMKVISSGYINVTRCAFSSKTINWSLERKEEDKEAKDKDSQAKKESSKDNAKKEYWLFSKNGKERKKKEEEVRDYLTKIFPLYAKDVVSPQSEVIKDAFKAPLGTFSWKTKDGVQRKLNIGKVDEKANICLIKDNRGYYFKVDSSWCKNIEKPFKKKEEKKGKKKKVKKK